MGTYATMSSPISSAIRYGIIGRTTFSGFALPIALAEKNPIPTGGENNPTPIASTTTIA